ncbi:DUF6223 family protein [Actinoplanes sp. Pm04-4]|uniref:DUF6223 family protein n=1 Tax=Paractinoplanes pyxinae TaxID=2997416 RepID=A0ABT4B2U5_9ACTN|nr:DUF6223 family protein [Actinoplanes pyxinae]MCY1140823.1 DUF6223 family protein [Actinoplanes pyxinae]
MTDWQLLAANHDLTGGRLLATTAALVALTGVVLGGQAVARRAGRGRPMAAVITGVVGLLGGAFVLAVADGGPGTGNGVVGAWAALAFGLIGTGLGALALIRSRREAPAERHSETQAPR